MHRIVHPLRWKRISKSEIRQIEFSDEFNDENAEHIRHSSKSVISLNIPSEEQRKKASSFFKPKWMRSSDEGQKVSRIITIKRWLLQPIRPKQHKKKSNNCQKEQLITNDHTGFDNEGFIDEEIEEDETDSCTENRFIPELPVYDLPLIDILSDDMNENKTPNGHTLDTDSPNLGIFFGVQENVCSLTRNSIIGQELMVHMFDPHCLSLARPLRPLRPLLNANPGECFQHSAFSGECTDKENAYNVVKYNQQKLQIKLTQRLVRLEKRNTSLMRRGYEMTATLVRQSRTITRQDEYIESMDKKLSKLERKLKKQKEKPTVVNKLFHMKHVDSFTIISERNN